MLHLYIKFIFLLLFPQRESLLSSLTRELGEVRGELSSLQAREGRMEREVQRNRRQVDLSTRPEVTQG